MPIQLVMTVGTNPLPLFVAWTLLAGEEEEIEHVFLLHTRETEDQARALSALLAERLESGRRPQVELLETATSDPVTIQQRLREDVAERLNKGDTLHVHFSGGTKAQSVHAHSYGRELAISKGVDYESSYLDPRSSRGHALVVDGRRVGGDARGETALDLRQIAELHGWKLECKPAAPSKEVRELASSLLDQYGLKGRGGRADWLKWGKTTKSWLETERGGEIKKLMTACGTKPNADTKRRLKVLASLRGGFKLRLPTWLDGQRVAKAFEDVVQLDQESGALTAADKSWETKEDLEGLVALLNFLCENAWLEVATYGALQSALAGRVYQDVHMTQANSGRNFQLDVLGVLGYQVLVVSCTTSPDLGRIKQKAFEAYHRARQVGGAEARAVVVCTSSSKQALEVEEDVGLDLGGHVRPVEIWGGAKRGAPLSSRGLREHFKTYLADLNF